MMRNSLNLLSRLFLLNLFAAPIMAAGEAWTDDYPSAKQVAEEQGKDILLDFTGSDWCGWCIKLDKEVFSQHTFKRYAKEHFILVEVDFPRNKSGQSDALQAQNNELKETFAISGFPSIILADAQGLPYAKTGYQRGGAAKYVRHLRELKAIRVERDGHMSAAEKAQGTEKAKHLHAALQAVGEEMALQHYAEVIEQIIALDKDGQAGLAKHYQGLLTAKAQRGELHAIARGARRDARGAITKMDELLTREDLIKSIRQETLAQKSLAN
jgi:thioredoxin-related protein